MTRWTLGGRVVARAVAALTVAAGALLMAPAPAGADGAIETGYSNPGSWGATHVEALGAFTVFSPSDIGRNGHDHAVVVWGNGTNVPVTDPHYRQLFDHLVSWGFVVIAPNDSWVGTGQELEDARNLIVWADATSGNRYTSNIDQTSVGVMGHSQGAGGALVAAMDQPTHFQAVATWAIPNAGLWCNPITSIFFPRPPDQEPCRPAPSAVEVRNVTTPAFFIYGETDFLSTRFEHDHWTTNVSGPSFDGELRNAGHSHLELLGSKGYLTAWFRHTLEADPLAGVAFAGATPEPGWSDNWSTWGWNGQT